MSDISVYRPPARQLTWHLGAESTVLLEVDLFTLGLWIGELPARRA